MTNDTQKSHHFIETIARNLKMPSMHYHSSYEIYYLVAGSREYFVEDKFFSVSVGNFILIPPKKFHRTGGNYVVRTLVGFSYEFLLKTYTPEALDHLLSCFKKTLINPPDYMQAEFKALLKNLHDAKTDTDFSIYLGMLLSKLSKCHAESSYDERISKIIEYINNNFSKITSIEQIANEFFVSKHHLCRIFKNIMGMTLIEYLNNIKIRNACNMLESSNKSILEIAELCGFNSSAYFSNVFKKINGISPSEFLKTIRARN